jgi:hypothetical protein
MPAELELHLATQGSAFRVKKKTLVFRRQEAKARYKDAEKRMILKVGANSIMSNTAAEFIGGLNTNQVLFSADKLLQTPVTAGNQLLFGMRRSLPDHPVAHHHVDLVQPEPCQGLEALFTTIEECAKYIKDSPCKPKPSKTAVLKCWMRVLLQLEHTHIYQSKKLTFEYNNNGTFLKALERLGEHRLTDDLKITLTRCEAATVAA